MKKILNLVIALTLLVAMSGCDDFLERNSLTTLDDQNYWESEATVRLFVNGAYGTYFNGYARTWSTTYAVGNRGETSDEQTSTGVQGNILLNVPSDNWYRAEQSSGDGYWLQRRGANAWNYAYIRKWNLLMNRLDRMKEGGKLTDEAYNHWMGVARFFRGYEYSRFVQSFGDIPYFGTEITDLTTGEEFAPRVPRTTVMNNVLEDFQFAMANVRVNDGTDYVNRDVVATIASRCMLFEGTWYIYHKNDPAMATAENATANSKKFLEAARDFAQVTINSGKYGFNTDYRSLFGTLFETLTGKANEVIMYRTYNRTINSASQHCIASYANGAESQTSAGNLSTLRAWICQDGKAYASSEVANVDSWRLQDMVVTRDPRFEATFWDEPKGSTTGLYCEKFIDREGVKYSYNGQARPTWYGSCTNENGFPVVRYAETVLNWIEAKAELAVHHGGAAVTQDDLDKSINAIRNRPLDDVAIAKGVKKTAPLTIEMARNMNDPERTSAAQMSTLGYKTTGFVDPLIWEIRRERRMEFFMERYRTVDIRRWGQLELMLIANNPDLGIGGYVELDLAPTFNTAEDAAEAGFPAVAQTTNLKKTQKNTGYNILTAGNIDRVSVMPIVGTNADGSLKLGERTYFNGSNHSQMRGFLVPVNIQDRDPRNVDVRNYLEPICTMVIDQYTEKGFSITQNPGW